MLYDVIFPEPSTFFLCYLVICDSDSDSDAMPTLTPVPKIEEKKRKKHKVKGKVKRNLGSNFISLTRVAFGQE